MTAVMTGRRVKLSPSAAVSELRRIEQTTPPRQLLPEGSNGHAEFTETRRCMEHHLMVLRIGHELSVAHLADYLRVDPDPSFCIRPDTNLPEQLAMLAKADLTMDEFTRLSSIVLHYELDIDDTRALLKLYHRLRIGALLDRVWTSAFERMSTINPTSPIVVAARRFSVNESCMPEFLRLIEIMALHNMSILQRQTGARVALI